jgi:DNA helicase II / ATP-dependent DNA helicase PcrA
MNFIADFHVHSKYSRATARRLDLENLYVSAQIKGIGVIGTGDFTHPAWWAELCAKLVPAEEGLFALAPEIARACDAQVPPACRRPVRFMLVTEISNIYKKEGRTRKNHNLVFMPDRQTAGRFNRRLDGIGNVRSDGRPILGLDARNLLEIVLDTTPMGYLVPAHIWTPWFSLLGSKSGFDSVEQCFEDLSDHIFALETGLSSDPPMNRRVSGLDRFALISNSDAHSPAKLGREANRFDTDLSYTAMRTALQGADGGGFLGTIEFFPEEGKYHVDGHRKCNFRCLPSETRSLNNVCPVCGTPLVLGVLNRVEQLADRPSGVAPPADRPFCSLIPLREVLAEVLQSGPTTKTVATAYHRLVARFGAEFDILGTVAREDLDRCGIALLGEAIDRMRSGRILFDPGYDGAFGRLRIFDAAEREALKGQRSLFALAAGAPQPDPCSLLPGRARAKPAPSPAAWRPGRCARRTAGWKPNSLRTSNSLYFS